MNYLVTGAAGFIGSSIVKELMREGNKCTTIDNFSTGKKENVPNGCKIIEGNVADLKTVSLLLNEKFDAIIHMAGQSSGEVSFDNPTYDLQTNVQSTIILLEYAKNVGCKKFIYASSMSVYGDHIPPLCKENNTTIPKSFYAVGKLASENYLRIYAQYGIACTALRFFNVYGKGQNMQNLRQGMVSIYLAMALKDHHIVVKGSKDRFRDFVYIDDAVRAVIDALSREKGYKVFNVCTKIPTTVEQVIEIIQRQLGEKITVEYSGNTPGDQFGIYGDNEEIEKELNWIPKYDFQTGMKEMIEWARNGLMVGDL